MSRFVVSRNNKIDRLMSVPVLAYREGSPTAGTFIPRKWAVLSQQQQDADWAVNAYGEETSRPIWWVDSK